MKAKGQLSRDLGALRAGDQLVNGLLSSVVGAYVQMTPGGHHTILTPPPNWGPVEHRSNLEIDWEYISSSPTE